MPVAEAWTRPRGVSRHSALCLVVIHMPSAPRIPPVRSGGSRNIWSWSDFDPLKLLPP